MPRDSGKAPAVDFWTLAEFLRGEEPSGWTPRSIDFERELATVRAAGRRWSVTARVRAEGAGHGEVEIVVTVAQESDTSAAALTAARRNQLFRFFESVERLLWRHHFGGRFGIDRYDDMASGSFNKYVKTVQMVRRELALLAKLRFHVRGAR